MIGLGVGTMEEEISLKDMFRILKRRFTIILATFLFLNYSQQINNIASITCIY